jgi:queuine/archaeosine tRNA-ribosyltransferase
VPILKKSRFYRHRKNKTGVDVIPIEDREVSNETYANYIEIECSKTHERKDPCEKADRRIEKDGLK